MITFYLKSDAKIGLFFVIAKFLANFFYVVVQYVFNFCNNVLPQEDFILLRENIVIHHLLQSMKCAVNG